MTGIIWFLVFLLGALVLAVQREPLQAGIHAIGHDEERFFAAIIDA